MANRKKRLEQERVRIQAEKRFRAHLAVIKKNHKKIVNSRSFLGLYIQEFLSKGRRINKKYFHNQLRQVYKKKFIEDIDYLLRYPNTKSKAVLLKEVLTLPKLQSVSDSFLQELTFYIRILQIAKPLESWKAPRSKDENILFKSLYIHLFVSYRLPRCVLREFEIYSFEMEKPMRLALTAGAGIHFVGWQNLKLNGKVNYFFNNSPDDYQFVEAIWWAKFRTLKASPILANCMVKIARMGKYWKWSSLFSEFISFVNKNAIVDQNHWRDIFKFLLYQRNYKHYYVEIDDQLSLHVPAVYPNYSLKGRTLNRVLKHLEDWNAQIEMYIEYGKDAVFPVPPFRDFFEFKGDCKFSIKRIKDINQLAIEGRIMKHCVYTHYTKDCIVGDSIIYSVKQRKTGQGVKRVATIEIFKEDDQWYFGEFKGKCNERPEEEVIEVVKKWVKQEQIDLSKSADLNA